MPLSRRHLIGAGVALGASVRSSSPAQASTLSRQAAPSACLSPLKWAPRNRVLLQKLIADYGKNSRNYDPSRRPYAVFDWDNTCIAGDCEETLLQYAASRFLFALAPQDFARATALDVPERPLAPSCVTTKGAPVSFSALHADLVSDYTELSSRTASIQPDDPALLSLKSKLQFAYDAIVASYDADVSCRWIVRLFSGHTHEQLAARARTSNFWHLGQGIAQEQWITPPQRPGQAGIVAGSILTGLRLCPEIADLQATLRLHGIDVFICSASLEEIVSVFATDPAFGYALPRENILGIRMDWPQGRLGSKPAADWPITVREGKVRALQTAVANARGYGPVLVCGDSSGDCAMMTAFETTRHALIINRCLDGDIGRLSARAAEQIGTPQPRFLLQGRNDTIGEWCPSEEAILFGAQAPRLLAKT
ncbi:haloacid dehalogenase-like hydrolase [Acetobacter sp.]|uniref:haloacid dehalogenase-like hydrolase n=1 Tax=Acetobacter sp. TaxID=440 RepID=UPI0039E7D4F5